MMRGDDISCTQLIGKGKKLKGLALDTAKQSVTQCLQRMEQSNLAGMSSVLHKEICLYPLAHKCGDELLWSRANNGSKVRQVTVSGIGQIRACTLIPSVANTHNCLCVLQHSPACCCCMSRLSCIQLCEMCCKDLV